MVIDVEDQATDQLEKISKKRNSKIVGENPEENQGQTLQEPQAMDVQQIMETDL